jgi:hypothetical protein
MFSTAINACLVGLFAWFALANDASTSTDTIETTAKATSEDVPRAVDFRRRSGCDGQAVRTIAASFVGVRTASRE